MTFANKITLFRIITIPFFIASLIFYEPDKEYLKYAALGIFLLAVVSDAIDGYIARTKRQKTRAGAILDPLADKALLLTAFIFIYKVSKTYFLFSLPLWVLLIVISRDVIILSGSVLLIASNHEFQIKPTWWGKLTTSFQMATIVSILLELKISPVIWWIASIFTVISGIDYARRGINALNNLDRGTPYEKPDSRPHP
jgi:CDP-diacylglycerol--glycerol-3-phosphate 3-phosphatidyltransferase